MAYVPYCSAVIILVKIGVESNANPLFSILQIVYQIAALEGSVRFSYFEIQLIKFFFIISPKIIGINEKRTSSLIPNNALYFYI